MQTSQRRLTEAEERNKTVVLDFYDKLCRQWNVDAALGHIGASYRQHNPTVADGTDGLRTWVDGRPPFADRMQAVTHRVLVDGDFVVLHNRITVPSLPDIPAMVIVDMFRLADGKVVEHWDVIQPEPAESLHANGMV